MAKTITSANSKFTIRVPGLGGLPFTLQGYATDAAFATEPTEVNINQVGVDGLVSTGYVPSLTNFTVTLQANSESNAFFENWLAAMKLQREAMIGQAVIDIPSIGKSYAITHLSLTNVQQVPSAQRVLGPVTYSLVAGDVQVLPLSVAA